MEINFKVWFEEHDEDRDLRRMLLKRLGFEPHVMDTTTIKLRDLNKNRVKQAVGQMGLDGDTVENLKNFVDTNPDTTLQNLLDQIDASDKSGEDETDIPSKAAKLPAGQQKPQPEPPQPDPAMMGQYGQTFGQ